MSLGVLNNIAAIYAQNNLNLTQSSLQSTLTQLSSGSRINSGADDAAGLAVADGLHANEAALSQSALNAQNGIGLLQTADGALSQVTSLLDRAVTLSTESANGTLTSTQASSANQEYQNILTQINAIGGTTNFNSRDVFSTTAQTVFVSDGTAQGANVYSEVVGKLATSSVGLTAPTGVATGLPVPTATASASTQRSTGTLTFSANSDTASGGLTLSLGGTPHSVTFNPGTSIATIVSTVNADATFSQEGISATLDGTGTIITLAGPPDGSGTLAVGPGNITDSGPNGQLTVSNITQGVVQAASTGTFTLAASTSTYAGTLAVGVAAGPSHTITVAPGTTGAQLADQINSDSVFSAAHVTAAYNPSTLTLTVSSAIGAGNDLSFAGTALQQVAQVVPGTPPNKGVDFTAPGLSALSNTSAQAILTSATTAIAAVAYQRGIIGADINILTAASGVASSESENLTAAETAIRSTNYGSATSDLAKYKVLSETGISALAQANSVQEEVTKLLQ